MGKMKRLIIVVIAIIIVLILVLPISLWFLVFEKPIKASPDELILTADDLPGWEPNATNIGLFPWSYSGTPPSPVAETSRPFTNSSNGFGLVIAVKSFKSSWEAHELFAAMHGTDNRSIENVNEASTNNFTFFEPNPTFYWYCTTRIANVIVFVDFDLYSTNGTIIHSQNYGWMDQIISAQIQKIQQFNTHF